MNSPKSTTQSFCAPFPRHHLGPDFLSRGYHPRPRKCSGRLHCDAGRSQLWKSARARCPVRRARRWREDKGELSTTEMQRTRRLREEKFKSCQENLHPRLTTRIASMEERSESRICNSLPCRPKTLFFS